MKRQTLMLIGGSDSTNGDYSWLLRHNGESSTWSCPKNAKIGDDVLIYISSPISKVLATAKVVEGPRPGAEFGQIWRYVGIIGPIRHLPSPIPFAELRSLCPNWAWLRYPRGYAYVPDAESKILSRRARKIAPPTNEAVRSGGGFGDPETNRRIERASIRAVIRRFQEHGFTVESRESECLGYDLDVIKGRQTLHVEVKGVAGDMPSFPITAGEIRCARQDRLFRLAVVTNALNKTLQQVDVLTAKQFLGRFALREISFMASPKRNGAMSRK